MNSTTPKACPNEPNVVFFRARNGGRLDSLGTLGRALVVVLVHWVHSGMPWGSSGSFGYVLFILALAMVVVFIRVLWVHSGAPWRSSGTFDFVGFIPVRPRRRRVQSGTLGSFVRALGVVVFIPARSEGRWGTSCGSLGSFGFVGFIQALPGGRWVHSGWLGSSARPQGRRVHLRSFGRALVVVGFIRVHSSASLGSRVQFIRVRTGYRRVNSASLA